MTEITQADKDLASWLTRRMDAGPLYEPMVERLLAQHRTQARTSALEEAAKVVRWAGHPALAVEIELLGDGR